MLRTKTVRGVHKELLMFALVYNLVRLVMLASAKRQRVAVERISFSDTLHWLCHFRPGQSLEKPEPTSTSCRIVPDDLNHASESADRKTTP